MFVTASACSLWALAPGGHKVVARGSCPTFFTDGLMESGFWPRRRRENADHPQVPGALNWKYVGEPWQLPLLLRPVPEQQFRDRTASWWRTSAGSSHLSRSGAADYDFIQGMFLFTNLQLYGIIGTAVLVTAPGLWRLKRRGTTLGGAALTYNAIRSTEARQLPHGGRRTPARS